MIIILYINDIIYYIKLKFDFSIKKILIISLYVKMNYI